MKEIAIIGSTASGKSDLALEIAQECNGVILSLDSLSVYKEIDIASAKPSKEELSSVLHFGVDEVYVNESFNVVKFFDFYRNAKEYATKNGKNLVIVGGTGFYLKMLLDGISDTPVISKENRKKLNELLEDPEKGYEFLKIADPLYAEKINSNDKYRIEKALTILLETGVPPSQWHQENRQTPIIEELKIFNIETVREELRKRVYLRTGKMFEKGIVDEAAGLEKKYGLGYNPLHSIGLKECYQFLNGKVTLEEAKELVSIHTMQLAKRQVTFNKNQFENVISKDLKSLKTEIKRHMFC